MTKFIEKGYMVASIMKINRDYLHKNYVSKKQLNIICWGMQKRFNELNINAIIVDYIDAGYFEDLGDVVMLKHNYNNDFESVEQRFQSYLPIEILSIIWNEELMLFNICDNYQKIFDGNAKVLTKKNF